MEKDFTEYTESNMKNGSIQSFLLFLTHITPALGFPFHKARDDRVNGQDQPATDQRVTEWFGLGGTLKII